MIWHWPQVVAALLLFIRLVIDTALGIGDDKLSTIGKAFFLAIRWGLAVIWIITLYYGGFW